MKVFYFNIIALLLSFSTIGQDIVINEFQTENYSTIHLADSSSPDWIELYNTQSTAINLEGWALTDESDEPNKFVFPDVNIPANGYLVIYATGTEVKSQLHTSYKLSDDKDSLFLIDDSGVLIDQVNALCIPEDHSYGRNTDGTSNWDHFTTPSPGESNDGNPTILIERIQDDLTFSVEGGFYRNSQEVQISRTDARTTIFYTLDGDDLDIREAVYESPLQISSRRGDKDKLADIKTAEDWKEPDGKVFKATTLRARSYYQGCPASEDYVHSYFIDPNMPERYNVPVFSLTTEKDNFFDFYDGIYIPGATQNPNDLRGTGNSFQSGKAWERPVHIEMFDAKGNLQWAQHAGVRIHGNTTRSYPQKTLRLYARREYDQDSLFNYKFFDSREIEHFETILLRTPNADISNTFFKDALCHNIVKNMNLDFQAFSPSVVFLNGEYWGIHNIRERQDEFYIKRYHGVDTGDYDLISISEKVRGFLEVVEGDLDAYNELLTYIRTHDIQKAENYDSLTTMIDIPNFIDYHIAQLFLANEDWPNANTKFWRERKPGGKWRWMFFDCDRCFSDLDMDKINQFTGNKIENALPDWATEVQRAVFSNIKFRKQFFARFTYCMKHFFNPGDMLAEIERLENIYEGLANEHVKRWQLPDTYYAWKDNVDGLKAFALYRPVEMLAQLQDNFKSPFNLYPNPTSIDFHIESDIPVGERVKALIYDQTGRLVRSWEFNSGSTKARTAGMQPGLYHIKLVYDELVFNHQLVLIR